MQNRIRIKFGDLVEDTDIHSPLKLHANSFKIHGVIDKKRPQMAFPMLNSIGDSGSDTGRIITGFGLLVAPGTL